MAKLTLERTKPRISYTLEGLAEELGASITLREEEGQWCAIFSGFRVASRQSDWLSSPIRAIASLCLKLEGLAMMEGDKVTLVVGDVTASKDYNAIAEKRGLLWNGSTQELPDLIEEVDNSTT